VGAGEVGRGSSGERTETGPVGSRRKLVHVASYSSSSSTSGRLDLVRRGGGRITRGVGRWRIGRRGPWWRAEVDVEVGGGDVGLVVGVGMGTDRIQIGCSVRALISVTQTYNPNPN
jgi:hypothetical protein